MRTALFLAVLLLPAAALAQPPQIVVQTQITPSTVMVGQQARLLVDVYFLGSMTHPPRVEIPDIDGAQSFTFSDQGTNMSTTIGGSAYTGQEFEFDIYARRAGSFTITPATVTLLDANGNPTGTMPGQKQTLTAQTPPGFSAAVPIVASPNVTMDVKYRPSTAHLAVGDSVTRIITRQADTVPGLSFSDIPLPAIAGATSYPQPPDIEDAVNRGDVTGERVDKVTFIFEKPGKFSIPAVSESWWNTDMGQAEIITAPGFSATILPAAATPAGRNWAWAYAAGIAVALAAAGTAIFWYLKHRKPPGLRKATERSARRQLQAACARTDATAAYKAFCSWRSFRPSIAPGAALATSISMLERSLFANTPWRPEDAQALSRAIKTTQHRPTNKPKEKLPALNPGQGA
jgi:hypothetical protein